MSNDTNELFRAEAASRALPEWLQARSSEALDEFLRHGFPQKTLENWRYTDLRPMAARAEAFLSEAPQNVTEASEIYTDPDNLTLVFRDGQPDTAASHTDAPGLSVRLLPEALDEDLSDYLNTTAASNLSGLNLALMDCGAVIDIAADTVMERPLHIVFDNVSEGTRYPRLLIRAGKNSAATVVEHHTGNAAGNTIAVTDIHCDAGANLRYQKVQEEAPDAYHVACQILQLKRDSRCDVLNVDLGAAIARNDLRIHLQGQGAHASATGFFLVDGKRHTDNHLHLAHEAPHASSNAHYAGVMADKGRGVFNGMIHVYKDAQKTDAALYNKNLLLTPGAEINTKPELEIYADDVKCAHGSTTGQLDTTALFYLRARGIPEAQARNMLIQSFAAEVFQHIATDGLRQHIQQAVETRLNELGAAIEDGI